MERIVECSAGLDVHRDTVVASIRDLRGNTERVTTRTFETYPDALRSLAAWLKESGAQVIAMESTGVYFLPVYRELRRAGLVVWVVNAAHAKSVPGRKTDVKDSAWLSKLAMHGLVRPSFIPDEELETMRMLTRLRVQTVSEAARTKNRVIRVLEALGIKLAGLFSDVLGKSGRNVLRAMLEGAKSPTEIAALVDPRMAKKRPSIERALSVAVHADAKWMLIELLQTLESVEQRIARLDARIADKLSRYAADVELLRQIPGLSDVSIAAVLAETGSDMSLFPSSKHISSWAGLAPGKNESAGKNKRTRVLRGNPWLRTMLVQIAWVVSRAKRSPWARVFARWARTTGSVKKAALAVAHKLLVAVYHVLKDRIYRPQQPLPLTDDQRQRRIQRALANLKDLGLDVTVAPLPG